MSTNNSNLKEKKIIFLSGLKNISDISESEQQKIIAFDYITHKTLEKNNISHQLADEFLSESDLFLIDKNSIKFAKWYEQNFLNKSIFFDDVNLGELLGPRFQNFLIPILKNIINIRNIFQLYSNHTFSVSEELFEITRLFTQKVSSIDKIDVKNNVSKYNIYNLSNPSENYLTLDKGIVSKLISILENIFLKFTNKKILPDKKTILIVNFTTRKNKEFLQKLSNFNLNFIKFDRILPTIWNLNSFSIIKKSGCIVENFSSVMNNDLRKQISQSTLEIRKQTDQIFEHNDFVNFFSLDGISFWEIIEPHLKKFFQNNLLQLITEMYIAKNLFHKYHFSHVLTLQESGLDEKITTLYAKKIGIPVSCLQHGLLYPNNESELDTFLGGFPTLSDNFFVWGGIPHRHFNNISKSSVNVVETGSTFYDGVKNKEQLKTDYILIAPAGLQNYTSLHKTISSRLIYEECLKQISIIATQLNKKLIIKIHHGLSLDEENIIKKINPDIKIIKSGSLFELIKSCNLLITLGPTTATLEALILKKPTFCVPINSPNCNILFENHQELVIPINEIEKTIKLFFSNNQFQKNLLNSGENFLKNYLINIGNASFSLLDFLEKN